MHLYSVLVKVHSLFLLSSFLFGTVWGSRSLYMGDLIHPVFVGNLKNVLCVGPHSSYLHPFFGSGKIIFFNWHATLYVMVSNFFFSFSNESGSVLFSVLLFYDLQLLADTLIILRGPTASCLIFVWIQGFLHCMARRRDPETYDKYTYSTVPDPHVFGPPGSGSASQRYGSRSGSGFFYHQAKIVRITLTPIVLWLLLDFFS